MSNMKHTNGPWKMDDSAFPAIGCVLDSDGKQIAQTAERDEYAGDLAGQIAIRNTNARLIAAAPDMLEALIHEYRTMCLNCANDECGERDDAGTTRKEHCGIRMRDVIEKATGKKIEEVLE